MVQLTDRISAGTPGVPDLALQLEGLSLQLWLRGRGGLAQRLPALPSKHCTRNTSCESGYTVYLLQEEDCIYSLNY